jgi:capsular polysaccharide biosynthesis protein
MTSVKIEAISLKHKRKFVISRQNMGIMSVTAPHRHDLQVTSCVNKKVEVFSRQIHKIMKIADNVKIIYTNLSRNNFTRHGLHLNISRKVKMAE